MVDLLLAVLISGIAVTFTIEFFSLVLGWFFDKERIYSVLALPFSFGALMCFYNLNKHLIIAVPATAFVVLLLNKFINKPVVINASRRSLTRI